jgi:phage FluMu protein Com
MFLEIKECPRCKDVTQHYDGKCNRCEKIDADEKERAWESQHIETKITNLRKRIEKLERGPARF